jgi:hypothetical protein
MSIGMKKIGALVIACILGILTATAPVYAQSGPNSSNNTGTSTAVQTPLGKATIINTPHGNITEYDTKALLSRKDVRIKTSVLKKGTIQLSQPSHSISPNINLHHNTDVAEYDLGINWVYINSGATYVCGYAVTYVIPRDGLPIVESNIQSDLNVTLGSLNFNVWTENKNFSVSFSDESPCVKYAFGVAEWEADGFLILNFADGGPLERGLDVQSVEGV